MIAGIGINFFGVECKISTGNVVSLVAEFTASCGIGVTFFEEELMISNGIDVVFPAVELNCISCGVVVVFWTTEFTVSSVFVVGLCEVGFKVSNVELVVIVGMRDVGGGTGVIALLCAGVFVTGGACISLAVSCLRG